MSLMPSVRLMAAVLLAMVTIQAATPAASGGAATPRPAGDEVRTAFEQALADGDLDTAGRRAAHLLTVMPRDAALVDELTYRLTEAGGGTVALRLLLATYPFADAEGALRERLIDRIALLVARDPQSLDDAEKARLRVPLETPGLRRRQAVLWAAIGDVAAARGALNEAVALQPTSESYRQLAALQDDPASRVRLLERAVALEPSSAATHAELGYAYQHAGRFAEASAAWARAAAIDPTDVRTHLARGYLYWRAGLVREARDAFEQARRLGPTDLSTIEQLVYVYQRLPDGRRARQFAAQVIDAPVPEGLTPHAAAAYETKRYGLQRLHEDLGRRITVAMDAFSGTSVGAGPSQAEGRYSSYSQLEMDVRLGREPIRNGRTLSVFTRLTGDGGSADHAAPVHHATAGVGLRWKPWTRQVVYLSGEARAPLDGSGRRDVLVRASGSFLNGGRFSDDWRPGGRGWLARNLYLDAAHYVDARYTALTSDLRASYHLKTAARQTVEPYGHLQIAAHRHDGITRDIRAGIGSRWNVWYGGTRYDAPRHKLSIGLEFQHAIETPLQDRHGLFLSVGSRW